jgi:hypothetical protein
MVRQPDATMEPAPHDNQLTSKHRVLSFKPQLRLEWRGHGGQNETEQPDHSASLGDSITSSTRIRFSVRTGVFCEKGLHGPVAADPQGNSYVQQLACEEDRPFSRYLLNRAGRDCAAADERKPESALRASIGRTLARADRRRRLPSSRSARGPDREGLTCKLLPFWLAGDVLS